MKLVGFKEKYDPTLFLSKSAKTSKAEEQTPLLDNEVSLISTYLEKSEMIFSKTLALYDDGQYIGPYMVFSDGTWIWPSYLSYFLRIENKVENEFLHHIRDAHYNSSKLSNEKRREAITFFEKVLLNIG